MSIDNNPGIAKLIDHSLLRADASKAEVVRLCEEAGEHGFFSVCIHPPYIGIAREVLFKTHVKIATVIGFPLGMNVPEVKVYEAMAAAMGGADELDIVMNIGMAKSNNWTGVEKEISDIVTAAPGALHKVIIEACYLTDDQKKSAAAAVINSGAEFVKTSTGFGPSGASVSDVKLLKSVTGGKLGIKAAGGIKTLKDVKALLEAGATRIGTSSGVEIMKEVKGL